MKNFIHLVSFLCLVIFCSVCSPCAEAQVLQNLFKNKLKVELQNNDIKLNQADTTILIPYSLKGYRSRFYSVKLSYSNNNGTSYKGPLRSVKGDIGDSIKAGKARSIAWKFKRDNPYFDGKNISFKLEVTEMPKIATGGPVNAFRSILMPGLGDSKVRNGYNYGWIAVGTYAALGTSGFFYYKAQQSYKNYKNRIANDAATHDNYFKEAKRFQNVATGFLIAGATVWIGDVIGVYIRGVKNKKRIAREKEKLKAEKSTETSSLRISPYSDGRNNSLVLLWKF